MLGSSSVVTASGRSRDTVLLGVGNCLIFFLGSSAESLNLGVVVYSAFKVDLLGVELLVAVSRIYLSSDLSL